MDEIYGVHLGSHENLIIPEEYNQYSLIQSGDHRSPANELGFQSSDEEMKAKIASHPCYSKLLDAYIDCQKV